MIGIQVLAMLFVLWMTYFSFLHYRRGEFSLIEYLFWQLVWIGLGVIVIFPASIKIAIQTLGFSRAFDLLTVGGIVILFGVTFRNYVLLRRTERKVEDVVRTIALKPGDQK